MNKKFLLITGGTGGHVIPAINFANYLLSKNIDCKIIVDKRGNKYIYNFKGKTKIIHGSNLNGSIISKIFSIMNLIYGFFQSFIFILNYKPSFVISFGSYASFFPMVSCLILKNLYGLKIFIHEQNSILGRTNKFFINFSEKVLLNFDISLEMKNKFKKNFYVVGTPQKNNLNTILKKKEDLINKFTVFIYGGSQGSEFISNFSTKLIKNIDRDRKININFIFQCSNTMIDKVKSDLENVKSNVIIKEYFYDIDNILNKTTVAISRAGAGSISDLMLYKIPSILIPLPTAKDNHQFYNASLLHKHDLAIILSQDEYELDNAKNYIYKIYDNKNKFDFMNKQFDKIFVKNSNSLIYKLITNEK